MEIEEFFTIYQTAAWRKDAWAMINLYDEKAVIFDMWDQGYPLNAPEWRKTIEDWLGGLGEEKVRVEFKQVKIHQAGNVGFASALIQFQAFSKEDAILRQMTNRISLGFTKLETGWKVVHQHTSAPIRSTDLVAILAI